MKIDLKKISGVNKWKSDYSKVVEYKVSIQKSAAFLYTCIEFIGI